MTKETYSHPSCYATWLTRLYQTTSPASWQGQADVLLCQWRLAYHSLPAGSFSSPPFYRKDMTIDLHGYQSGPSYYFVRGEIGKQLAAYRKGSGCFNTLQVITGQGHHSKGGVPVLKPLVNQLCSQLGLSWSHPPENPGIFIISLCLSFRTPSRELNYLACGYLWGGPVFFPIPLETDLDAAEQALTDAENGFGPDVMLLTTKACAVKDNGLDATSSVPTGAASAVSVHGINENNGLDATPSVPAGAASAVSVHGINENNGLDAKPSVLAGTASNENNGLDAPPSIPAGTASAPRVAGSSLFFHAAPKQNNLSASAKPFCPMKNKSF
jgi:hypothetical protein